MDIMVKIQKLFFIYILTNLISMTIKLIFIFQLIEENYILDLIGDIFFYIGCMFTIWYYELNYKKNEIEKVE